MGSINAIAKSDRACREVCKCACRSARVFNPEECSYGVRGSNPYHRDGCAPAAPSWNGRGSILAGLEATSYQTFDATNLEVVERLISALGSTEREFLIAIFLDARSRYIADEIIATGDNSAIEGRFRSIIGKALGQGISGVVLVHNHPSGHLMPSAEDLTFTRAFSALCRPLDLVLVDHLIVAEQQVLSLKKAGWHD